MSKQGIIYCRVSTQEQTRNCSLRTQEKVCRDYCQNQGIEVDRVFVERGESAKTADRPELQALLRYCRENYKKIDYLIVYAVDRLARNSFDHGGLVATLGKLNILLRSATQPLDDTSTGKLVEGMLAVLAQFDNDVRSERTTAGMQTALRRGIWTFQPPLGYSKPGDGVRGPSLVPDPCTSPLVKEAFELYASGRYTQQDVLQKVSGEGLRTRRGNELSPQGITRMLRNPIYAGRIVVEEWGIDEEGDFQPIIPRSTFDKVKSLLDGSRSSVAPYSRNNPDFPLRRFVRCESCGTSLTGSWSAGRTQRYAYYRCPKSGCGNVSVRREELQAEFLALLDGLRPLPEYVILFREAVRDSWHSRVEHEKQSATRIEKRIKELERQRQRLLETFVYERAIDEATYNRENSRLQDLITASKGELSEVRLDGLDLDQILDFAELLMTSA